MQLEMRGEVVRVQLRYRAIQKADTWQTKRVRARNVIHNLTETNCDEVNWIELATSRYDIKTLMVFNIRILLSESF